MAGQAGLTPQDAVRGGVAGLKIAKELGVTPTQAAKAGVTLAKAMK